MTASVDIRRADRGTSTTDWLDSKHSFSFAGHYDPSNTHHGLLLVNNDDIVAPAAGFDTHPHRDMEIVTWVLQGSLEHRDSMGNSGVIYPGPGSADVGRDGVLHSEKNDLAICRRAHDMCISCRCGWSPTNRASTRATSRPRSTTSCCAAGW